MNAMDQAMKFFGFSDPVFFKLAAGSVLYLGGGKMARAAGIALVAWGGWDWWHRPRVVFEGLAAPSPAPWSHPASTNLGRFD
jgi:hypothetical protein